MKFLVDACIDSRLASHLAERGNDVQVVGRDVPGNLDDIEILAIAHRERRILVTNDRDFGQLVFDEGHPHAGIILLRLETVPLATRLARLDDVLTAHQTDLERFIVVTVYAIRVR